jgi:hypothetical protein
MLSITTQSDSSIQSTFDKKTISALTSRLIRIESKLVRGFEELGINIDTDEQWIDINDNEKRINLKTLGRSLMVIYNTVNISDTNQKEPYSLYFENNLIGEILVGR